MPPSPLAEKLVLPNGVVLPNRLAKAATSEQLADRHGAPTGQLIEGYAHLARSGAGLLISGNVMPVVGMIRRFPATMTAAWMAISKLIPAASSRP